MQMSFGRAGNGDDEKKIEPVWLCCKEKIK